MFTGSLWLHEGGRLWEQWGAGTKTREEAAMMFQAGEDGGWAREGAAEGEKWAAYEPGLKVELAGLANGLNVKRFVREGKESGMTGSLSA